MGVRQALSAPWEQTCGPKIVLGEFPLDPRRRGDGAILLGIIRTDPAAFLAFVATNRDAIFLSLQECIEGENLPFITTLLAQKNVRDLLDTPDNAAQGTRAAIKMACANWPDLAQSLNKNGVHGWLFSASAPVPALSTP
jgi:hypothetical protein